MNNPPENNPATPKITVIPGFRNRRIEVIEQVASIVGHRLESSTKPSYLQHGRLWLCKCDCGTEAIYSEHVLRNLKIKSCGCIKKQARAYGTTALLKRREIKLKIKLAQNELSRLIYTSNMYDNHAALDAIGAELRSLFAQKAQWSPSAVKARYDREQMKIYQELRARNT